MANFSDITKFAKNDDLSGFRDFLEKIYLRASFSALLTVKNSFAGHEGGFYTKALHAWLDFFASFSAKPSFKNGIADFVSAIVFCINERSEPLEGIIERIEGRSPQLTELLRRTLFSFLRNTPPGEKRLRPRKALLLLGFPGTASYEDSLTPLAWTLYEALYRLEISSNIDDFKKTFRKFELSATQHDIESSLSMFDSLSPLTADILFEFIGSFEEPKLLPFVEKLRELSQKDTVMQNPRKKKIPPPLEVLYLQSPVPIELQAEPQEEELSMPETTEEELRRFFKSLSSSSGEDSPHIWAEGLDLLVSVVRDGTDEEYDVIHSYLEASAEEFPMRDTFRRELKMLMADGDMPESVSERAFELLSYLGSSAKSSKSTLNTLATLSDFDDTDDWNDEPQKSDDESAVVFRAAAVSIKEDLYFDFPDAIVKFLEMKGGSDYQKEYCISLLAKNDDDLFASYIKLFDFHLLKSGRILFDKLTVCAKAFVEFSSANKELCAPYIERARETLLYLLYYSDCPDMLKMEAFEPLKRCGYFDFQTADTIKRYALAFAKDSLLRGSKGAVCRALSDLISIKLPSSSRNASLDGKAFGQLTEDFVAIVLKEKKSSQRALDVLNHISFEDPLRLRALTAKIQPVNYREAIEAVSQLVLRYNRWAGLVLVEAAGQDFTDIRDAAVMALGKSGKVLSSELKERAIKLIIEKADECYDDEMRSLYLETAVAVDPVKAAEYLVIRCVNANLNDRKELGSLLLKSLESMSAGIFLDFFAKGTFLETIHRYCTCAQKDAFIMEFAGRFVEIYRDKYVSVYDESSWELMFMSDEKTKLAETINVLWALRCS